MDRHGPVVHDRCVASHARSQLRVVVVDDAECFRTLARDVLEKRGYVVVGEAETVAGARRTVDALVPDAVLLDVNLPDGSGCDLARELRQAHPSLAILLVSAMPPPECERSGHIFLEKSELASANLADFLPASGR
jgi:CheY-like chemotaxis protein